MVSLGNDPNMKRKMLARFKERENKLLLILIAICFLMIAAVYWITDVLLRQMHESIGMIRLQ